MIRDLRTLARTRFDVLVIGAGVYGAATAWDAAQRGLSVALVDRGDIGGGTSFNSLKTLHGGLRSLQALDLSQMRRFIRERRALARLAPHLVRPLPFVIPTTRHPKRSRLVMRLALAINDLVARDRNDDLPDPDLHLPRGRVLSRDETRRRHPFAPADLTGGVLWHDYQMTHADRLTFAFAQGAAGAGAVVATYVAADGFVVEGGRVVGARLRDRLDDAAFDARARVVVNAAGAWAPDLGALLPGGAGAAPAPRLSRAMNVIVSQPPPPQACGGTVDGRFLFLVPWRDVSILGTSHDAHEGPADALRVTEEDLEQFLADGRRAFPGAALDRASVRLVHRGLLPMLSGQGTAVRLLRESAVVDHAEHGAPGLISVHGVRYTTARHTAQETTDAVFRALGAERPPACRTARTPLPGGEMRRVADVEADATRHNGTLVPPALIARLVRAYGTRYDRVLRLARETPSLAEPLASDVAVTGAEIVYAARHELAVTLADALIRRTEAGSAGHPGEDAIRRAAALMAAEHGWDAARTTREIDAVEAFYRLP
jgi:glycerol-3-phosphate dehydrogenase